MEYFYTIKDNYAEIKISSEVYPLVSVKKALSNFFEEAYIKIEKNNIEIKILLKSKENNIDFEKLIGEFYNELLRETLRYNITKETQNLRELIVGRALYSTCIEAENENETLSEQSEKKNYNDEINQDYKIENIAVNWFDTTDKKG